MKLLNKRVLLTTLSSVMVIAPVVTVVSCGDVIDPNSDEMAAYRDLTSPVAVKFAENLWQEKVITTLIDPSYKPAHITDSTTTPVTISNHYWGGETINNVWTPSTPDANGNLVNGQKVKEAAQYYIRIKIQSDPEYIKKMGDTLVSSGKSEMDPDSNTNKYAKDWLTENGILYYYPHGDISFATAPAQGTLTDKGLEFLFESDKLTFRDEVYKFMISTWYLENTNKDQFAIAFKSRSSELTNDTNKLIDPANFMLIKEMLNNKYFASWNIELTEDLSKQFTDVKPMYFDDAIEYLINANNTSSTNSPDIDPSTTSTVPFNSLFKRSETLAKFHKETYDVIGDRAVPAAGNGTNMPKYTELAGYKGIATMASSGTKELSFAVDKMKEVTNVKPGPDGSLGTADDVDKDDALLLSNWDGFVVNGDLNRATEDSVDKDHDHYVSEDEMNKNAIRLVADKGTQVKLSYVHGIMPVWNGKNFVLNLGNKATVDQVTNYKHSVAMLFVSMKTDYYNEAMDFIRSESEEITTEAGVKIKLSPIILDVKNDQYKKILLDGGSKFVEARKV